LDIYRWAEARPTTGEPTRPIEQEVAA
jgi:hypothetical protein